MTDHTDAVRSRQHVYLSSNFWDGLWIIQQPICNEIRRSERVLYVERPVSWLTVLRYPRLWKRIFSWLRGARRRSANLWVLAPLPLFHVGHRFPRLFRLEFSIQRVWILWWARVMGPGVRVLWMDNPLYECAVSRMGERASVYHVADEVAAFPSSHPRILGQLERALLQKVSLVFAASEQLARDKRRWHPRAQTIWNAIDAQVFAGREVNGVRREIDDIPTPRAAFVGVLDQWVDLELLVFAAARLPHVHFLLVGDVRVNDDVLRPRPNVHFLGRRDRLVIPAILRRCSVSLVPFRITTLTERIVPLKVFEALAAGLAPVCTAFSTDLDMLEREGLVLVARSADEFVRAIEQAITVDGPEVRARRAAFGLRQTWGDRWEQMNRAITECVSDRA